MTVFVTNTLDKKIDLASAVSYGDLYYINHRYVFIDELNGNSPPSGFQKNIDEAADRFQPRKDYLLIAGDHLQIVMMTAALAIRYDSFFVLRYDREARGYMPILIGNTNREDIAA